MREGGADRKNMRRAPIGGPYLSQLYPDMVTDATDSKYFEVHEFGLCVDDPSRLSIMYIDICLW